MEQNEVFIKLKKSSALKIGIQDENGKPTGEYLEFDVESINYISDLEKCYSMHNQNQLDLEKGLKIIEKKYANQQPQKNDKYLFTKKEKEENECLKNFYKKEMEAIDLFIGKDGSKKLLNGREPYYRFFEDFTEYIEPILPLLEQKTKELKTDIENSRKKIIEKYGQKDEEMNVLK